MNDENRRTLDTYDQCVDKYIANTTNIVSGPSKIWIDKALNGLPLGSKLFELGSAHGRDAGYIQYLGYRINCSDASMSFVTFLRGQGMQAIKFDALIDELDHEYDLILANAVLLHFDRQEFAKTLRKMCLSLKFGGKFAFTLKRGYGEEWSSAKLDSPRYFCYWQPDELPWLLSEAGFARWSIDAVATDRKHADWIFAIALR